MPNAIVAGDREGTILFANERAETIFGYGPGEMAGLRSSDLAPGSRQSWVEDARKKFWETQKAGRLEEPFELYGRRKDGSEFPIELGLNPISTPDGAIALAVVVDITARKQLETRLEETRQQLEARRSELEKEAAQRFIAEVTLERSREEFRYLFARNPLPMLIYEQLSLRVLEVNEAALAQYGYTREEFRGMTIFDIRPREDFARLQENLKNSVPSAYQQSRNWKHLTKTGKVIEVDIFSHALVFEGVEARLVVAIDVTERNAAELQLRQSQKLEALGQLTGGVAHDFNNLLMVLLGNLEAIQEETRNLPAIRPMLEDAMASVARGSSLTHRLLAYARQQPLEPRLLDLASTVREMTELLSRTLGEEVHLLQHLPEGLWKIRLDPGQLESVLLNLAVNARDAMPRGGTITLGAQNVHLNAEAAALRELTPGDYVLLTVKDDGEGIPEEHLEHVFEPFFTTKPMGKGSGLGLSMVYGFARQSGGHLSITSKTGEGTCVSLYFPRTYLDQQTQDAQEIARSHPSNEVILLVEDDPAIRKLILRLLEYFGFKACAAEDGPEAMKLLETMPPVDLLLTDVVLPNGMSGYDVATHMRKTNPQLKVLYMSGYTGNELPAECLSSPNTCLLQKPFRKEEMKQALVGLLSAKIA